MRGAKEQKKNQYSKGEQPLDFLSPNAEVLNRYMCDE